MRTNPTPRARTWRIAATATVVVATLVSLVLRARSPMWLIADSPHDDMLYARLGGTLVRGEWLGVYDGLNIAKGPGYPLFIAVAYKAHLPLKLAEQLVHLLAAGVTAVALARVLRSRVAGVAVYVVLALDPAYLGAAASKVSRDGLYGSAGLLLFGGTLLLLTAVPALVRRGPRWWAPVMVGAGLALGLTAAGYALTREERAWIAPALLVAGVAGLLTWRGAGRVTRAHVLALGACGVVALVVTGASLRWVAQRNDRFYGEAVTSELVEGSFPEALDQWQRVEAAARPGDPDDDRVPVTAAERAAVYAVSPTARQVRTALEDPTNPWRSAGCTHTPPCDYSGAIFGWALRSAALDAGYMGHGDDAERWYAALADDIEQACADGELRCTSGGIGPLPPLASLDLGRLWSSSVDVADDMLGYDVADPDRWVPSGGSPVNWDLMTGALRGVGSQDDFVAAEQRDLRHQAPVSALEAVYRWAVRIGSVTALLGLVAGLATRAGRRRLPVLVVALAALVAFASRVAVVAILDATAFDVVGIGIYVLPGTQFIVLFAFVGTWLLGEVVADRLRPIDDTPPGGEPEGRTGAGEAGAPPAGTAPVTAPPTAGPGDHADATPGRSGADRPSPDLTTRGSA